MIKNLVIVESPAKAKTIEKFLGEDFTVRSCFGHIRDLSKKDLGVDIQNGFIPQYEIPDDKAKIVGELKKMSKDAQTVWLASDEDREGEAISWHLSEALQIDKKKIKRIAFHEITKTAIQEAIAQPRQINIDLVDAQQARRVLDRLVGYELSPLLWKKIRPSLSAGRVQSVAVRLIVERENEINNFKSVSFYKGSAIFSFVKDNKTYRIKAELSRKFTAPGNAMDFLKKCIGAQFHVKDIETKPAKKSPAPPFTTSTLQQEASRKLGFSVSKTMLIAQQLYESGKITYMRTDSVNLSKMALAMAKNEIESFYGPGYVKIRNYITKSKGAQEAHEAIRPTYINNHVIEGNSDQKKLYDLIWKRTIASQMSDAELEKTNVYIESPSISDYFLATGEIVKFDGFLKVYLESTDDEEEEQKGILPPIAQGDKMHPDEINVVERFTQQPPRYTEASLVKKLEELGIGRPSTYAPIISTIQKREYVTFGNKEGAERKYLFLSLINDKIQETQKTENFGYEKAKLFPTDVGTLVNNFLIQNFENILDYNFTASVEKEFDEIAEGKKAWNEMIREFYFPFHNQISETEKTSKKVSGVRLLGFHPESGKNIYAKLGKFGGMLQLGENTDEEKPRFVGLLKGQSIETISLQEALSLLSFPKLIGTYQDTEIVAGLGRFGPYIRHDGKFYSLKKTDNPITLTLSRAIEIINEKISKIENSTIKEFAENPGVRVLKGRFGPYISMNKNNYKIPKEYNPADLTIEDCMRIAEEASGKEGAKKRPAKKTGIKKTVAKKTAAKKTITKKTAAKKTTVKKAVKKSVAKKTAKK
ncbi:MAG TPA: type I DNA topoisomerase [Bacteroidales bacterium]|nr:type I DNA topoisomerase [Bacteroidales bacterium]HNZ43053.1 type I DNA topoisomerase [Bacteroidales bacterium]HOH83063.1 type I DNA topoisomerase [Bacteroidales bacterium]HPB24386.1 type I DNA topoisomerase [Bacteroidales bacterium]HPI31272.1 type I DNA topoisomerase [Bacteroidales bacterium]